MGEGPTKPPNKITPQGVNRGKALRQFPGWRWLLRGFSPGGLPAAGCEGLIYEVPNYWCFGFLPRGFHYLVDGRELIHPRVETVDFAWLRGFVFLFSSDFFDSPKFLRLPFAVGAILKS